MEERTESSGKDRLTSIADAITQRVWLETQRKSESIARIKNAQVIRQPVPLTEARLAVASSMIRNFLESPNSVEEVAANLLRFTLAEQSVDEIGQRDSLSQLPTNEKSGLIDSISNGITVMFEQDAVTSLNDYLLLLAKAEELSKVSGNQVTSYFTKNDLFEELIQRTFKPMDFAQRRLDPIKRMLPGPIKRLGVESVIASMIAGDYSEAEIEDLKNEFENNVLVDTILAKMVEEHKIVELTILVEELSRFYGFDTVLKLRPQLKEIGLGIEISKIPPADAF